MDRTRIAFSDAKDTAVAMEEIKKTLQKDGDEKAPKLIFFTTDYLNFTWFSRHLAQAFPNTTVIGMSSYVVLSSKGYNPNAVTALAIYSGIEIASGIILEIDRYPLRYKETIRNAVDKIGENLDNTCCFEFTTAFSGGEELIMDAFKIAFAEKQIPIFGGTAGAPDGINASFVALNGIVYNDACAFVIIKNTHGKIRLFKENMFKPTEHIMVATDVDCDDRTVYEYNNRPAAEVVAAALGVPVNKLFNYTSMHPVGRIDGDNIYITEHNVVYPDGQLSYYSRIHNYSKLVLLEPDDPKEVWNRTANAVKTKVVNPSFSIVVNCLSRTRYFNEQEIMGDFVEVLSEYGTYIGFSGYGEQYEYEHLNQTMILAVFE